MTDLERIKRLLGVELDEDDTGRVQVYIENAKRMIANYSEGYIQLQKDVDQENQGDDFPSELNWIVDELVLGMFNRFHNEGMKSISEEGLTINYGNGIKDYLDAIQGWVDQQAEKNTGEIVGW